MRIAQVAPLIESVPPRGYGGTERVVAWLSDELVRMGHDVTVFATADSSTSATLVPCAPHALRTENGSLDPLPWHVAMFEEVAARAKSFDVVHFHTDVVHFPVARRLPVPSITTLHGRLDLPGHPRLYETFSDITLVSISDAQRAPLPNARWIGTVHHGLPLRTHDCGGGEGGHFVFLGRMSREKRPDRAIEIAKRAGVPLKIAAKVDDADRPYFEREIRPLLDHPLVEMLGEVDEEGKGPLLGSARALLFPIDWPEPFGLVMIEAMVCGTPVIAYPCGSVPEIVEDGVTGFITGDLDSAVEAAERAGELDRRRIRARAEQRFSAPVMAEKYLALYERVAGRRAKKAA